jgi:hypothetical protein
MGERLFLFPELAECNPTSFLQTAVLANSKPFQIDGYKLFALIDRLDDVGHAFCVVPVPFRGKSAYFYQYCFPSALPDFESLGLSIALSESGDVLFVPMARFLPLSAEFRSISVKNGNWTDAEPLFHELAAYAHLDLFPSLCPSMLRSSMSADTAAARFRRLYDSPSLAALYGECVDLLKFFCFAPEDVYASPDASAFYFGALRQPAAAFHRKAFPSVPLGKCCLSPGTVRQLRFLHGFVVAALDRLGFPGALAAFQRANGLCEGPCGKATLRRLWTALLSGPEDPVAALAGVGVAIAVDSALDAERFGEIPTAGCDDGGQKIALGLSRSVANLSAPRCIHAAAQRQLAATAQAGVGQIRAVGEAAALVEGSVEADLAVVTEIEAEAAGAAAIVGQALRSLRRWRRPAGTPRRSWQRWRDA